MMQSITEVNPEKKYILFVDRQTVEDLEILNRRDYK